MKWTSERQQQVRDAWDEGLSVTLIAERLEVTRGMVSGQVRKMKLPKRSPERQPHDGRKVKQRGRPMNVAPRLVQASTIPPHLTPPTIWKTLLGLEFGECKWPLGERDFVFCALETKPGLPYCACHARIAYQAGHERQIKDAA